MSTRSAALRIARAAFLVHMVSTAGAFAQSPADRALAESLFREGKRLFDAGETEAACTKFAESHRMAPALGALLNLAACHEKAGRTASAWVEFTEAATMASRLGQSARERFAKDRVEALTPLLSNLTLVVAKPDSGVTVELDGKSIGSGAWGTPVPVDPGEHDVRASASGKQAWETRVTIPPGPASTTVSIPELAIAIAPTPAVIAPATPAPVAKPPASSSAPTDDSRVSVASSSRTTPWIYVAGGVAALGFASGTYFGVRTFSEKETVEKYCDDTTCSDSRGLEAEERAYDAALLSTVSFGVGLAASGVLVYLLLSRPNGGSAASTFELSTAVGRSGIGVSSAFRF